MGNHRDTAARIWRTIVCSGAMLGTPLAAADTPKQAPAKEVPAKTAPAKTTPAKPVPAHVAVVAELELDATAMISEINRAIEAIEAAQSDAERTTAKNKLAAAQQEQAILQEAIALAKRAKDVGDLTARATAEVTAAKTEMDRAAARLVLQRLGKVLPGGSEQDLVVRINQAIEAVNNAQNDADRSAAKAKLAALQKEAEKKQKAAEAARRPRTPAQDRPTGRGFILS
jgi:hypothetical protein